MRYLIYRKSTEQNRIVHIELRSNDLGKSEYILLTMTYVMYNLPFLSKIISKAFSIRSFNIKVGKVGKAFD